MTAIIVIIIIIVVNNTILVTSVVIAVSPNVCGVTQWFLALRKISFE